MELLCTQCRGIRPHLAARGKSHGSSQAVVGTSGTYSSYGGDGHSKRVFVQPCQDSCLVTRNTSGISTRLDRAVWTLLELRRATECTFLVAKVILEFLSIFRKSQKSSCFEALNVSCLSRCQRDVRPPVQMRLERRAFSTVSTGDAAIPSSCEMKDEPAFKPLQGNPAFLCMRASQYPFYLRQQTQGPSHIPIAEGRLLLRYL